MDIEINIVKIERKRLEECLYERKKIMTRN